MGALRLRSRAGWRQWSSVRASTSRWVGLAWAWRSGIGEDGVDPAASGMVNSSFQVGGAVVTAIVSAAIAGGHATTPTLASLNDGVVVIITSASLGPAAAVAGAALWRRTRPAGAAT